MAPQIITRAEARAQGLKRYFTGRPCKRGHIAERRTDRCVCVECQWAMMRARNAAGLDAEKRRIRQRRSRAAWSEERKAAAREYLCAYNAKAENREVARLRNKAWDKRNPDKVRASRSATRSQRRAQKLSTSGTHTAADLAEILAAQGHRCAYCRASLKRAKRHVDHIMPLARGGSNGRSNLQYLCAPCNQTKNAKDPIEYARSIGLLL